MKAKFMKPSTKTRSLLRRVIKAEVAHSRGKGGDPNPEVWAKIQTERSEARVAFYLQLAQERVKVGESGGA